MATDLVPRRWDVVYLDLRRRFPLPDASVERIYAEHVIEHLTLADGEAMLREAHRVLRPGGRIRLATPDVGQILALAQPPLAASAQRYVRLSNALFGGDGWADGEPLVAINRMFYGHGHRFLYDLALLSSLLERCGFTTPTVHAVGSSDDPSFRGLEQHGRWIGEECNAYETLVVEADRAP